MGHPHRRIPARPRRRERLHATARRRWRRRATRFMCCAGDVTRNADAGRTGRRGRVRVPFRRGFGRRAARVGPADRSARDQHRIAAAHAGAVRAARVRIQGDERAAVPLAGRAPRAVSDRRDVSRGRVSAARGQPLRHQLLGAVNRYMARLLVRSASRVFTSTPQWGALIAEIASAPVPYEWTPVPSNLPTHVDAERVRAVRDRFLASGSGTVLIGHFGTYGGATTDLLLGSLRADHGVGKRHALIDRPRWRSAPQNS